MSNQLSPPAPAQPPSTTGGAGGSPPVSRPSGISTRPQHTGQGRLRSRSINNSAQPQVKEGNGNGGVSKQGGEGYLAPTLVGSPEVGGDHFGEGLTAQSNTTRTNGSPLGRSQPSITRSSGDNNERNGSGSLSASAPSPNPATGPYANAGPAPQVRRGRSFTSLLVQPATPSGGITPFEDVQEEADDYFEKDYSRRSSSPDDIEAGYSPHLDGTTPALNATDPLLGSTSTPPAPEPARRRRVTEFLPHLAILLFLFVASFGVILALVASLSALFIPHSFSQLPALVSALVEYRASSWLAEVHLFAVLSFLFVWKQAFSIPGSILTNAIFGALYGTAIGTAWACLWTAVGSTGAYGIARVISPLVEYYFATPLAMTRRTLKLQSPAEVASAGGEPAEALSSGDLFSYLLLARFFPLLPYSVMNVISGVLRLPLPTFFITLVLGSFPFNFVTVSVGSVVAVAAADPDTPLGDKIWTGEMLAKLVGVTVVSVAPMLFKKQIQKTLGNPRLAATVVALPTRAVWGLSRMGDSVVRQVGFILGTATPETQAAPVGAYQSLASHLRSGSGASGQGGRDSLAANERASHETTDSEGGRAWRHKWNPSWGGDGFRLIGGVAGTGTGAGGGREGELLGRWEEEDGVRRAMPGRGQTM